MVVIINHSIIKHESFEKNKEKYGNNLHFKFQTRKSIKRNITPSKVTTPVKLQSLDVVDVLKSVQGLSKYFLFMEDDFKLCPNGIKSKKRKKKQIFH